jgi:hypothetical protein
MIANDFDVDRTLRRPFEINAPLAVDPDAEPAAPVTRKPFKPVSGRGFQVAQRVRGI